ncbi:MFS transporter [Litorivivens sp.]|uniref:MFS transporter n=1 Tax=Litorivivens sp. TaxID=2020868 RepID=UPI003562ADF7
MCTAFSGARSISPPQPSQSGSDAPLLADAQYRWLLAGNTAFFFAMNGQILTRSILAWDLVGEATALAYINLVVAIPMLLGSLLGGAITDRVERRQLVILGQSLIVLNEITILTLLLLGKLAFWHMLCTAFITGCAFPLIMPARMAITASVAGASRMQRAMAYTGGVVNVSRIAGPAVMGLIIAQFSVIGAYVLSVALYSIAVACMLGVKPSFSSPQTGERKSLMSDIGLGLRYVNRNRPLMMCILFSLLPMLVAMPFQNILVMLAEQAWQQGEQGVGLLISTGGVGGVVGALWIIRRGDTPHRLVFMVTATLGFAVLLGAFAQTSYFLLALLPLLLANTFISAAQTVNSAAVQILTDENVRGRVSSLMMASFGLMPLGVFPMAIAADHFGAANAITGACAMLFVAVALFYLLSPTFRSLDATVSQRLESDAATKPGRSLADDIAVAPIQ